MEVRLCPLTLHPHIMARRPVACAPCMGSGSTFHLPNPKRHPLRVAWPAACVWVGPPARHGGPSQGRCSGSWLQHAIAPSCLAAPPSLHS